MAQLASALAWGARGCRGGTGHSDMKTTTAKVQKKIRQLRRSGKTHRNISLLLNVSLGTAFDYSRGIRLTKKQHLRIMHVNYKKGLGKLTNEEHHSASLKGGINNRKNLLPKYSKSQLIQLLKSFYIDNGRMPIKKDFISRYGCFFRNFGTWNNAIMQAGFSPNPVLFAKKYIATDGHTCDSFSEKIIDDWLSTRKINHERNIHYGKTKFTADFKINDTYIEFFGLHGQLTRYDMLMKKKLQYVRNHKLKLISLYPNDLFPKNNLEMKLHDIM